jgi:hypothetical protein
MRKGDVGKPVPERTAAKFDLRDWIAENGSVTTVLSLLDELDAAKREYDACQKDFEAMSRLHDSVKAERDQARRLAARYREALEWYARGEHMELPDWESASGEPPNLVYPPNDEPWHVEDGTIARKALAESPDAKHNISRTDVTDRMPCGKFYPLAQAEALEAVAQAARKLDDCLCEFYDSPTACAEYAEALGKALSDLDAAREGRGDVR